VAVAVSDAQVEKAYKVFLKYADVSSPKEAADDLEAMGMDPAVVTAVREKHEAETIRIRNLDQPPSVWRDGRVTWYTGPKNTDRNWPAIVKSMQQKNFGDANITSVDEASTKILSLLDHPKQNEFRTLGLVVGFVQSGKTRRCIHRASPGSGRSPFQRPARLELPRDRCQIAAEVAAQSVVVAGALYRVFRPVSRAFSLLAATAPGPRISAGVLRGWAWRGRASAWAGRPAPR
jgi:hypothetical protein